MEVEVVVEVEMKCHALAHRVEEEEALHPVRQASSFSRSRPASSTRHNAQLVDTSRFWRQGCGGAACRKA